MFRRGDVSCFTCLVQHGNRPFSTSSGGAPAFGVWAGQQQSLHQVRSEHSLHSATHGLRGREAAARAGARDVAHWCEALAHAQPSPFLPLHVPRQRAGRPRVVTHLPQQGSSTPAQPAARPPRSFFRRPLSAITVAYSSKKGRAMLSEIIDKREGGDVFLDIMTAFEMQRHPVSCGMASLTIALNALKLAPWRRVQELDNGAVLALEEGLRDIEEEEEFEMVTEDEISQVLLKENEKKGLENDGVSLQTLAEVALRVDGIHVERLHAEGGTGGGFSEAEFRKAIIAATSVDAMGTSGVRKVMLLNFGRPALGQTGSGHFSPIAAWHPPSDMALVLDTARFKYPAFWAPVDTLFQSCATLDQDTEMGRGFLLLSKTRTQEHAGGTAESV